MFWNKKKAVTVQERVAKGMHTLDANVPGWHHKVRTQTLDISNSGRCALGQTYGSYSAGFLMLGLSGGHCVEQGFQAEFTPWGDMEAEYAALTDEWKRQITERRESELCR